KIYTLSLHDALPIFWTLQNRVMNYQNRLKQIALTKIPMVGAITAKNLVSYCGSVDAVFEATKRELLKIPGIGAQTAAAIINHDPDRKSTRLNSSHVK